MILDRAAVLVVALAAVACGGREGPLVGISPPRAAERIPGAADAAAAPWIAPSDFRSRLSPLGERFLSRGHAERFDAVVWGDPSGTASDAGGAFADGTMFVEETFVSGESDGGSQGLLMMEKRAGSWRFGATSSDGEIANDSRLVPCVDCHREAPHDFVFRAPGARGFR
jgi:hypothetical protein